MAMVALETVDLALDVVLKTVLLALLFVTGYLVLRVDRTVKSLERAARNVEKSSDTVDDLVSVLRKIPFIGPKGEKDD